MNEIRNQVEVYSKVGYPPDMKRMVVIAIVLGIISGGIGGLILGYWVRSLPYVESLAQYQPDVMTVVLDDSDNVLMRLYTERRIVLKRSEIPERMIQALLSAEDADFYKHSGVDFPGIMRALLKDIRAGKFSQGASTITQQLARMLFLTNERTLSRKIKEAILSVKIERYYSKDEIITIYLNQSYFGHGAYGVESAARTFFGKSISQIGIAECALLAGLLKNPAGLSPFNHPDRALKSRNHVLKLMLKNGFLDQERYQIEVQKPLNIISKDNRTKIGPYFIEEVRKELVNELGAERVLTGGLTVHTTLNQDMQTAAEAAVLVGTEAYMKRHNTEEQIQAALIAIKPGSGEIKAMVGGVDFNVSKFNRAVQAKRQPGSAIKPFIYLTAFMEGYKPNDLMYDVPSVFKDPSTGKEWRPRNYGRKYWGLVPLRVALEKSLNVVTIKLLDNIGIQHCIHTMNRAGIESRLPPYLSIGLGSGEVSLLELTNAYATVAAKGLKAKPLYIRQVADREGNEVVDRDAEVEEVFDEDSCYQLIHVLEGAVRYGTCWRAKRLQIPVAAKTGTTNKYTDAWFIGFTPDLVVGVWVGFDLKKSLGDSETGSRAAGPIFVDFMDRIKPYLSGRSFEKPNGIKLIRVCRETGKQPGENCSNLIFEAFKLSQDPIRQIVID